MQATVDNLWCSPSTLHMRVIVFDSVKGWRHKYDVAIPLDELGSEVYDALAKHALDRPVVEDLELW